MSEEIERLKTALDQMIEAAKANHAAAIHDWKAADNQCTVANAIVYERSVRLAHLSGLRANFDKIASGEIHDLDD
ncbi:MAG: hypothetical protein ACRBI6_04640 [Acidimicrobiales bacterium]